MALASVNLASLLDFLDVLATGAKLGRDEDCCGGSQGVVQALRFVACRLGLESLSEDPVLCPHSSMVGHSA